MKPVRIADDLIEIRTKSAADARALAKHLRQIGQFEEAVAGLATVCVRFPPGNFTQAWESLLNLDTSSQLETQSHAALTIPVTYGGNNGPDLQVVANKLGLTTDALIELHTSREHRVELIGFTPGFAYVSGMPPEVQVPRLPKPRARVPAGSIGLSASNTGIYALQGPGGWPLIGHTAVSLFDAQSETPFRLQAGQVVRLEAM